MHIGCKIIWRTWTRQVLYTTNAIFYCQFIYSYIFHDSLFTCFFLLCYIHFLLYLFKMSLYVSFLADVVDFREIVVVMIVQLHDTKVYWHPSLSPYTPRWYRSAYPDGQDGHSTCLFLCFQGRSVQMWHFLSDTSPRGVTNLLQKFHHF